MTTAPATSLLYKYLSDFGGVDRSLNYNRFWDDGVEILDLGFEQIRSILSVIFDPENHDTQLEDSVFEVITANSSIQWINLVD